MMHTAYFDIDCGKMGKPTFRVDYMIDGVGVIIEDVIITRTVLLPSGRSFEHEDSIIDSMPDEFEQYIIGLIRGEI